MVQFGLNLVLYSTGLTKVRENHYTSILFLEVLFIDFTNLKFTFSEKFFEKKCEVILVVAKTRPGPEVAKTAPAQLTFTLVNSC